MLATGVGGACGAFLVLILLPFVCEEMEDVRECVGEVDIMDDLRGPWGASRAIFHVFLPTQWLCGRVILRSCANDCRPWIVVQLSYADMSGAKNDVIGW